MGGDGEAVQARGVYIYIFILQDSNAAVLTRQAAVKVVVEVDAGFCYAALQLEAEREGETRMANVRKEGGD